MKLLLITDTYPEQINGVSNTIKNIEKCLEEKEWNVYTIDNNYFKSIPLPMYKDIKLAILLPGSFKKIYNTYQPDYIHIATEGPIGLSAKLYFDKNNIPYTTSYHTMFPEYIQRYTKIPTWITYVYMRWFHSKSKGTLVPTKSMKEILIDKGFDLLKDWTRGIDRKLFPKKDSNLNLYKNDKVALYVGRVSKEKNLDLFLDAKFDGIKVVVGDGPMLKKYRNKYPEVEFVGFKTGSHLSMYYSSADVFCFPSFTDTFGNVILESLSSGVPVVAFDVQGPKDIINNTVDGILIPALDKTREELINGLEVGLKNALLIDSEKCIERSKEFTWENTTDIFVGNLYKID